MKKPQRPVPPENQEPSVRFASAKQEAANHGEWGQGESGYRSPGSPSEKMRKNVPYKVRPLLSSLPCQRARQPGY